MGPQNIESRSSPPLATSWGEECRQHGGFRSQDKTAFQDRLYAPHNKLDCQYSPWDAWGGCSATCGGGQKVRQRAIAQVNNEFGEPCKHSALTEVAPCGGTTPCADTVDCSWSEWSYWSACTCTGLSERHRSISVHSSGGGVPCSGAKVETKRCTPDCNKPPEDCVLAEWSSWTECTQACGGGQAFRTRSVLKESEHGGKVCADADLQQTKACAVEKCEAPVDCQVGAMYTPWKSSVGSSGGSWYFCTRCPVSLC